MDASPQALASGVYLLTRRSATEELANMDSWIIEITVLSTT
jgi:hypothetical protein